jgi:hypothetical protein
MQQVRSRCAFRRCRRAPKLRARCTTTSHQVAGATRWLRARCIRCAHPHTLAMLTRPPGALAGPLQAVAQPPSRGLKRSRSPENSYADLQHGDDGTHTALARRSITDSTRRRRQTSKARPPAKGCKGRVCRQPQPLLPAPDILARRHRAARADTAATNHPAAPGLAATRVAIHQIDPH